MIVAIWFVNQIDGINMLMLVKHDYLHGSTRRKRILPSNIVSHAVRLSRMVDSILYSSTLVQLRSVGLCA